jgi:hypothetical protein
METIMQFRNNCTLVAIKEITGADDAAVLAAVRKHNYKNNQGMYASDYMAAANDLGIKFGEMKSTLNFARANGPSAGYAMPKHPTLGVVASHLKKGTFLVRTKRHVLVVRDGKIVDTNWNKPSLRRDTFDYVEVLNPHAPEKKGFLKSARRAGAGCKYGSKNWHICKAAHDYLATHKDVTAKELLDNCSDKGFHRAYLNWELKRGNIVEI